MADHDTAWAAGLAEEHAHQRELLALVRGEIAAFSRECAAALSALDGVSGGFGAFASALQAGTTAHKHANLALDVGRRIRQARATEDEAEVYESFGAEGDFPERVVGHARSALESEPKRSDREIMSAVVSAAGVRSAIEDILGPAPVAVLAGLFPLARSLPAVARIAPREGETEADKLSSVLQAAGSSEDDTSGIAAAASLADSLRDAASHARGAAKAVEEGTLRRAVADARKQLNQDLDALRAIVSNADEAGEEWRREHESVLADLTAEVETKLDRLERLGAWLERIVPRLQLAGRALSSAENARTLDGQLDPGGQTTAEAARLTILLGLSGLWTVLPGDEAKPARAAAGPRNRRVLVWAGAALLIAAAGIGIGVWAASSGGSTPSASPGRSILPGPTNTNASVNSTPATTTNTTAVIPFKVTLRHGSSSDQFILSFVTRSGIAAKRIDYEASGSKSSPGEKTCTAASYPGKVIHCVVSGTKGSIAFYPEPPDSSPKGSVTLVDTAGRTYGPLPVSLSG